MFDRNLMKRTDNRPLQETPDVLYGVGVDVPTGVFADVVVDRLVERIFVSDALVGPPIVGVDGFGFIGNGFFSEGVESLAAPVWNNLEDDFTVPLNGSHDDGLVALISTAFAPDLTADESLVDFDDALKFDGGRFFDSGSDSVAEIPGRPVGHTEGTLHLFSGDTLLGFHHHVGREEPLRERKVAIVEDGASGHREPEVAVATIELVPGADS